MIKIPNESNAVIMPSDTIGCNVKLDGKWLLKNDTLFYIRNGINWPFLLLKFPTENVIIKSEKVDKINGGLDYYISGVKKIGEQNNLIYFLHKLIIYESLAEGINIFYAFEFIFDIKKMKLIFINCLSSDNTFPTHVFPYCEND